MPKVYVASFINEYDYDTFTTSSELLEYTMSDFARGNISCAGTDRDRVLDKAKKMFIEEYAGYGEESETPEGLASFIATLHDEVDYIEESDQVISVEHVGTVIGSIVVLEFEEA